MSMTATESKPQDHSVSPRGMLVGGQWVESASGARITVENPEYYCLHIHSRRPCGTVLCGLRDRQAAAGAVISIGLYELGVHLPEAVICTLPFWFEFASAHCQHIGERGIQILLPYKSHVHRVPVFRCPVEIAFLCVISCPFLHFLQKLLV